MLLGGSVGNFILLPHIANLVLGLIIHCTKALLEMELEGLKAYAGANFILNEIAQFLFSPVISLM